MALSKETIKRLRAVQAAILAEPELYDQGEYPSHRKGSTCGTPCCIAGWAVWVNNPDPDYYNRRLAAEKYFDGFTMSKELGISQSQAQLLFAGFPIALEDAYNRPTTPAGALAGAKRIDLFISSGGTK